MCCPVATEPLLSREEIVTYGNPGDCSSALLQGLFGCSHPSQANSPSHHPWEAPEGGQRMELHTGLAKDSHTSGILFTGSIKKGSLEGNVQPTSTVR